MRKIATILLIAGTSLFAVSAEQEKIMQESYNIGKQIVAKDGTSFEWTLTAIGLTESSAGKNIIGDEHHTKKLVKASLGVYQIRLATAKEIIKKDKLMNKYYAYLLEDENRLATLLLTNSKFSGSLAATYLKMMYNRGLKKHLWNPHFYAVSKYNGGAHNKTYYNRVMNNLKTIRRLKVIRKL